MIYTSYFAKQKKINQELEDVIFVSVSVGNPKYGTSCETIHSKVLKPYGIFGMCKDEEFEDLYVKRLNAFGVERIRKELEELQGSHKNMVLCCHEKDAEICHRRMFARWWEKMTGEEIQEYEVMEKKVKKEVYEQLSLF